MYRPNEQDNGMSLSRVLIAVGLSIAFFAVYAYFFPQKPPQEASKVVELAPESTSHSPSMASNTHLENTMQDSSLAIKNNQSLKQTIITRIQAHSFEIDIDALGRIRQVYLKDKKFTRNEQNSLFGMIGEALGLKLSHQAVVEKLPLFGDLALHTMEVRFSDVELNKKAFDTPYTASATQLDIDRAPVELTLKQNLGEIVITKYLTIHPNLSYDVRIELNKPNVEYFVSNGMRPTADSDTYAFRGVLTRSSLDGVLTQIEDGDASSDYIAKTALDMRQSSFVASVDRYYTSLFYSNAPQGLHVVLSGDNAHNPMPFVRFEGNASFAGYIGPRT